MESTKKADSDKTDSGLQSMPDDDLASLSGFEAEDSEDEDPLGHLQEELRTLNTKIDQLESNISKKVTDDIQSSVPSLVANALKAHLLDLISGALKNILPQLLKDSIHQSVQESIKEKFLLFDAQVQQTLQDQLPSIILMPMNKQFNAFNTLESRTFVTLQKELSKVIQNKMGVSIKRKVRKGMKAASDKLASV
ncbi:hypothetical protein Tco_0321006 [Tanacetum coccineum]